MPAQRCPTCGQPIASGPRRVCALCGEPIGKHHKWRFGDDGRAQHRDCANPIGWQEAPKTEGAQLEMAS